MQSIGWVRPVVLAVLIAFSVYEILWVTDRNLNIAGAIILALTLFSLRENYRTSYGLSEILVGMALLVYSWRDGRGAFSAGFGSDFDRWIWQVVMIKTFAAVYVIVRGLDNVKQGSKNGGGPHHRVLRWLTERL